MQLNPGTASPAQLKPRVTSSSVQLKTQVICATKARYQVICVIKAKRTMISVQLQPQVYVIRAMKKMHGIY